LPISKWKGANKEDSFVLQRTLHYYLSILIFILVDGEIIKSGISESLQAHNSVYKEFD